MEPIGEMIQRILSRNSEESCCDYESLKKMTHDERLKRQADRYNSEVGSLNSEDGFDCQICKNKGLIMSIYQINGGSNYTISKCECMSIRYCIKLAKSSGLEKLLKTCTFKTYKADTEWQTIVKDKAAEYLNQFEENKWFYIGGQSGAGKTHICTAICRKLLAKNIPVRYMLWRDTLSELMRNMNNSEEYEKIIKPLKECRVLYIDDLFKNQKNEAPSPWEVKLAFEIINYRAIDDSLVTIISSEKLLHEIIYEIDEAIGGRIRQRAGGKDSYVISISNNRDKNYRLAD